MRTDLAGHGGAEPSGERLIKPQPNIGLIRPEHNFSSIRPELNCTSAGKTFTSEICISGECGLTSRDAAVPSQAGSG